MKYLPVILGAITGTLVLFAGYRIAPREESGKALTAATIVSVVVTMVATYLMFWRG